MRLAKQTQAENFNARLQGLGVIGGKLQVAAIALDATGTILARRRVY